MPIDYDKIRAIHDDTMRYVPNAGIVPDNSSWLYISNNRLVKQGTPYHIHYTNDFEEYYMSGAEHNPTSRIIKPIDPDEISDFTAYSSNYGKVYEKMADVFYKPSPEADDYVQGTFLRNFVKRRNDPSDPIREVDEDFTSPLYEKFTIKWRLTGRPRDVFNKNRLTVAHEEFKHPGIKKLLSNYIEYYIIPEVSELSKQRKALGISGIKRDKKGNIVVPESPAKTQTKLKRKKNKSPKKRNRRSTPGVSANGNIRGDF